MSIEGQGHFFTIYFPGFVCFVLYLAKISGERLQDHWSSGFVLPMCSLKSAKSFFSQSVGFVDAILYLLKKIVIEIFAKIFCDEKLISLKKYIRVNKPYNVAGE